MGEYFKLRVWAAHGWRLNMLSHTRSTTAHCSNESYLALLTEQLLVHPEEEG